MDPFAVLEDFARCKTPQEVGAVLSLHAGKLGYPTYAIGAMPSEQDPNPTAFTVHNWPDEWQRLYFERNYGPIDPVPRAVMSCAMPLTLTELYAGKAGFAVDPRAQEMLETVTALGRGVGLIVPISGPQGYHGIVVICGNGPEPDPRTRAILHLWGIYAHDRMLALHGRTAATPGPALTEREVEVLRLLRSGHGDDEMARVLAISVRTVRFHLDNAKRKLRARNRAEAVVTAVSLHLLGQ